MSCYYSLATIGNSAENSSLEDWMLYTKEKAKQVRDPLRMRSFSKRGMKISSVVGYSMDSISSSLIYYWHRHMQRLRWQNIEKLVDLDLHFSLACYLGKLCKETPNIKDVKALFLEGKSPQEKEPIDSKLKDIGIYWKKFDDSQMFFACLYEKTIENVDEDEAALTNCINFHFDYFSLHSPMWNAIPMRYLHDKAHGDIDKIKRIHIQPKCFSTDGDTINGFDENDFLWPWQQCLERNKQGILGYKAIETTSLVIDLRKSTIAMEQCPKEKIGKYPVFIQSVIDTAIEIVFKYGGFFDKETGDGLIAHFIRFDMLENGGRDSPEERAFNAASDIIKKVAEICIDFQRTPLIFGVKELGLGVGIHTGDAVWVSQEKNKIHAVGNSVVIASRLCSEADSGHIFVSELYLHKLRTSNSGLINRHSFLEKQYIGKEYHNCASLYGSTVQIHDTKTLKKSID
jgi:class 3 adenylate cyclase